MIVLFWWGVCHLSLHKPNLKFKIFGEGGGSVIFPCPGQIQIFGKGGGSDIFCIGFLPTIKFWTFSFRVTFRSGHHRGLYTKQWVTQTCLCCLINYRSVAIWPEDDTESLKLACTCTFILSLLCQSFFKREQTQVPNVTGRSRYKVPCTHVQ